MSPLLKTDVLANSFVILFHFLNFSVGLAALFIIFRRVNLVSPQVQRSFLQQAMFYNLVLILSAVTDFLDFFFREIVSANSVTLGFLYLMNISALGFYFAWSFSFAGMANNFLGIPNLIENRKGLIFLFIILIAILVLLLATRVLQVVPTLYMVISLVLLFLSLSIVLGYSIFLYRRADLEQHYERKHALKVLSILFIVFSTIDIFVFLNFYPLKLLPPILTKFSYNIMDLMYNCFILFWAVKYMDSLNTGAEPLRVEKASVESTVMKYQISRREMEVIHLVCEGKSNQEIADCLFISLGTVKNHLYNIYTKIGIRNRTQLMKLFQVNGH